MRSSDDDLAVERKLKTAADREPVHRTDHRLVEIVAFERHEAMRSELFARLAGRDRLQIPARGEHAIARRCDNTDPQRLLVAQKVQRSIKIPARLLVDSVRRRMLERDLENRAVRLDLDARG